MCIRSIKFLYSFVNFIDTHINKMKLQDSYKFINMSIISLDDVLLHIKMSHGPTNSIYDTTQDKYILNSTKLINNSELAYTIILQIPNSMFIKILRYLNTYIQTDRVLLYVIQYPYFNKELDDMNDGIIHIITHSNTEFYKWFMSKMI